MIGPTESRFGPLLRKHRKANEFTQDELVDELRRQGYSRYSKSTVSKWENGNSKPPSDVVDVLEDVLGVNPPGLLLSAAGYRADAELRRQLMVGTSEGLGSTERTQAELGKSSIAQEGATTSPGGARANGTPRVPIYGSAQESMARSVEPPLRRLYERHLMHLARLAGNLVTDIEEGRLENPRSTRKSPPGGLFARVNIARVFHSLNDRLWPFLSQHLDTEFPSLSSDITRVAAKMLVDGVRLRLDGAHGRPTTRPKLVEDCRAKLIIVSERGTFEGTCDICRKYFRADSAHEGQTHKG